MENDKQPLHSSKGVYSTPSTSTYGVFSGQQIGSNLSKKSLSASNQAHPHQQHSGNVNVKGKEYTIEHWPVNIPWFVFIIVQFVVGMIKYGPIRQGIKNEDCDNYFEFDIHRQCWVFWATVGQCAIYGCLFIVICILFLKKGHCVPFCNCQENGKNYAIPFIIWFLMIVWELVLAGSKAIFLVQVFIDFFGYLIWFIYAPAVGKTIVTMIKYYKYNNSDIIIKSSQVPNSASGSNIHTPQINKCLLTTHFALGVLLSFFTIVWLVFEKFYEDFHFDKISNSDSRFVFLQILFESLLVIEWIHLALETIRVELKEINKEYDKEIKELKVAIAQAHAHIQAQSPKNDIASKPNINQV